MITLRTHTDAVIAALEATGLTVGDAVAPGDDSPPYAVVYEIPGGRVFGSLDDPHEDATLVYQVTCVGITREQANWVADKAMVLRSGVTVANRRITDVDVELPGIIRDDSVTPPIFYSTPRFTLTSTPA